MPCLLAIHATQETGKGRKVAQPHLGGPETRPLCHTSLTVIKVFSSLCNCHKGHIQPLNKILPRLY